MAGDRQQTARERLADLRAEPPEEPASGVDPLRGRALAAAARAYTAAHGHPLDHRTEPAPHGVRWVLRPGGLRVVALALALLVGLVGLRHLAAGEVDAAEGTASVETGHAPGAPPDEGTEVWPPTPPTETPVGPPAADGAVPDQVVVHVVGQVNRPGVVRLAAGARVEEALEAAGGASADADLAAVNLARVLHDGEQLRIPAPGEEVAPGTAAEAAAGPASGAAPGAAAPPGAGVRTAPLDLNQADATALDALPGVGPVLAERILAWRAQHGRFSSVEELGEVSGIGPKVLEGLRELVTVG